MLRLASLLLVLAAGCGSDEPDLLDEMLSDLAPELPAYATADLTFEQLLALHCPGVAPTGATTYKGLTGTFVRLGWPAPGEPRRLSLVAHRDDPDAEGTYTGTKVGTDGATLAYAGRFAAISNNPAIGAAISFDTDGDGDFDDLFFVLGTRRAFGRVQSLCLGGAERPFLLTRTLF